MIRTQGSSVGWILAAASVAAVVTFTFARAAEEDKTTVAAEDLATGKVVVIGRLGLPLRTMMTVRGTWRHLDRSKGEPKEDALRLHVTHVDGKPLGAPVEFGIDEVRVRTRAEFGGSERSASAVDKAELELRAYEIGQFHGAPGAYWRELGSPLTPAASVYSRPFMTELHGLAPPSNSPPAK